LEQASKGSKASTAQSIFRQGDGLNVAEQIPLDTTKALLLNGKPYAFRHKEFARRKLESHKMKYL